MHQRTGLATTTAKSVGIRAGIENDEQRIIVLSDDGIDKIPFPTWKGRHNIEHGGEGGKVIVLFGDINLPIQNPRCPPPSSKNVKPIFPHQTRRTKKKPATGAG
ncbi:hypothetical protein [Janthinobacterium sp. LB3P118]|uniref:hypothetical protein n=1 Tax=Janthinobacterium sp. LB3P118 TaxID=3424195 RepID=UPI003F1F6A3C